MADNNIIINQEVSLPFPFGVHKAFPLDSRSFFSNFYDAQVAVRDAVELKRNQNGTFVLPSEENGGADSVYYYGQPIVVTENGADTVGLYLITKAYDNQNQPYGRLENVCSGLSNEYLRKSDAERFINELIQKYVEENLNTECIDDYLFTNAIDECGKTLPSDGLYAYGLKEVNGVLQKCEEAKKVLSFDPETVYDKNVNQLATLDSVRNRIEAFKKYLDDFMDKLDCKLNKKVDKKRGYGLSKNDFTDCLKEKLENFPDISVEGDKLTINGKSYKLEEWVEIFDYYIGWINLRKREHFMELSKDELLNAVKATGTVPPEGKLYGKDSACGYNTFFVMKRKKLDIDHSVRGEYSEWESEGLKSDIRTYIPSIMQHNDVMINDNMYDVYGLHTGYPNPSDTVQIAFNINLYDYYVGWMYLEDRDDFYSKTTNDLTAHAEFGNFDGEYHVYEGEYRDYNLFYLMVKEGVDFDEPVEIEGVVDNSHMSSKFDVGGELYGLDSPIRANISSVMEHDSVSIDGVTYRVYGVHTYRPNNTDKVHIVFSK